jgi:hypothetical protein
MNNDEKKYLVKRIDSLRNDHIKKVKEERLSRGGETLGDKIDKFIMGLRGIDYQAIGTYVMDKDRGLHNNLYISKYDILKDSMGVPFQKILDQEVEKNSKLTEWEDKIVYEIDKKVGEITDTIMFKEDAEALAVLKEFSNTKFF